ncbi:MAG: hypothetical protein H0U53_09975 [Actinobacteria bacterium]|nr:hypothetical protein [Actinomycetota bacterium]
MDLKAAEAEMEVILDAVGYELTEARRFGLKDPDRLRRAVKRARDHLDDADVLAGAILVTGDDG